MLTDIPRVMETRGRAHAPVVRDAIVDSHGCSKGGVHTIAGRCPRVVSFVAGAGEVTQPLSLRARSTAANAASRGAA